jgi:hypothetical protein
VPNAAAYVVCGDLDVKLMQTNIGDGANNNKFYVLQTLCGEGQFRVVFRWGRLGEPGQSKVWSARRAEAKHLFHGGNGDSGFLFCAFLLSFFFKKRNCVRAVFT